MKKKYITLEEVLALRGTDTKIYDDGLEKWYYYQFKDGLLCLMKDENIDVLGERVYSDKLYILEPEEFKVEKPGKYMTRDGGIAFVFDIDEDTVYGGVKGTPFKHLWELDGTIKNKHKEDDLVKYIGD